MNRKIQILDCTLRDGGRCFGNAWGDGTIIDISTKLVQAEIDIIEIGFLWYISDGICRENTTLFNTLDEISPFLYSGGHYVIYIEYELLKKENHVIPNNVDGKIDGIRLGILKGDLYEAIPTMEDIKNKGYQLFVQFINVLSYSELELKELIEVANKVKPDVFAIVDTYGAMYMEDLRKIYCFIDKYLDKEISIDFHTHNNIQLSLALAITFIDISEERDIIIDATLGGIGMGAGNLSTESIIKYLNEQHSRNYDLAVIVKVLDSYITSIKKKYSWESSLLTYDAASKWGSQINTSYITNGYAEIPLEKKRLLLGMCPLGVGVGKHTIDQYYRIITKTNENSKSNLLRLKESINTGKILLIAKGPSVADNKNEIEEYIGSNDISLIFLNASDADNFSHMIVPKYYFFSNKNSYEKFKGVDSDKTIICLSGLSEDKNIFYVDYNELIGKGNVISGNSTIIALNLLGIICENKEILVAGFDGTDASMKQIDLYRKYIAYLNNNINISFITQSLYNETL
ncbi:MAG: hypothetical protein WCD89_17920 [Anaerocolumna sp.]